MSKEATCGLHGLPLVLYPRSMILSEFIVVTESSGVLEIRFNRPDKKNAITDAMYGAMTDALVDAETRGEIRAVLITGTGDAFTAGNDLGDFRAAAAGAVSMEALNVTRLLGQLNDMTKPMVAAVNGVAVGIGLTMLLHCDLVYLAQSAKLSAPFVDLALVPEAGSSVLLTERIGYPRAYAVFALGDVIDAPTAEKLGLANMVLPAENLLEHARAAAHTLAAKAPTALRRTKMLMRDPATLGPHMAKETEAFGQQLVSAEARETFMAMMEKRPPRFG